MKIIDEKTKDDGALPKIRQLIMSQKNLIKYLLFGAMGAVIDYGICFLLTSLGVIIEAASVCGNICGFVFTFFTNTYLNFKKSDRFLFRFISYALVCVLGSAASTLIIYLLKAHLNPYFVKAFAMVVAAMMQYVLNKFITYRK